MYSPSGLLEFDQLDIFTKENHDLIVVSLRCRTRSLLSVFFSPSRICKLVESFGTSLKEKKSNNQSAHRPCQLWPPKLEVEKGVFGHFLFATASAGSMVFFWKKTVLSFWFLNENISPSRVFVFYFPNKMTSLDIRFFPHLGPLVS